MNYILRIYRGVAGNQYWEEFVLPFHMQANIVSALMEIQKNPVNRKGIRTEPVVWEHSCLEEVCGACSMLINGVPRQACSTLIRDCISKEMELITLAPLSKFPLLRDLQVDRSALFTALRRVRAWIEATKTQEIREFGVKMSPAEQRKLYPLATCMTCGCCSESCPAVSPRSSYVGPAAISQAELFLKHPRNSEKGKKERLHILCENDGIAACGNAQNCVAVCPKKIPLGESFAMINRKATQSIIEVLFR